LTKISQAFLIAPLSAICLVHPIFLDLITLIAVFSSLLPLPSTYVHIFSAPLLKQTQFMYFPLV
jgi:hypothetical protein